jgi:hypothetical protein
MVRVPDRLGGGIEEADTQAPEGDRRRIVETHFRLVPFPVGHGAGHLVHQIVSIDVLVGIDHSKYTTHDDLFLEKNGGRRMKEGIFIL